MKEPAEISAVRAAVEAALADEAAGRGSFYSGRYTEIYLTIRASLRPDVSFRTYGVGYQDGESSALADLLAAFDEVLDLDVDGPWDAARKVEELLDRRTPVVVLFDGPPGHDAGRFVEVATPDGRSVAVVGWSERPDGLWALGPFLAKPLDEPEDAAPPASEGEGRLEIPVKVCASCGKQISFGYIDDEWHTIACAECMGFDPAREPLDFDDRAAPPASEGEPGSVPWVPYTGVKLETVFLCEETGALSTEMIGGHCPVHGGDGCLVRYDWSGMDTVEASRAAPPASEGEADR